MLIEGVGCHKLVITRRTLLPCRYARANITACVPESLEANSSRMAQGPLAEERDTFCTQVLLQPILIHQQPTTSQPCRQRHPQPKAFWQHRATPTVQNTSGTLRDAVTATAYWQCSKDMSVVCRLSGNTAASPESGFLQAVIYQSYHNPSGRDMTQQHLTLQRHMPLKKKIIFFPKKYIA